MLSLTNMAPLDLPLKEASIILANSLVDRWLRAHGRPKQPELSEKQKIELRECFDIIDSAGTGVITTDEASLAFAVLNMDMGSPEIEAAIFQINRNKKSMEFPLFQRLILSKLHKWPADEYAPSEAGKDAPCEYTLPFALLAQAYRRKKLIEAVMVGDKQTQDRMSHQSDKAFRERKAMQEPSKQVKIGAKGAVQGRQPRLKPPKPTLNAYVIANLDPDAKEILFGEKRKDITEANIDSESKFVPLANKSVQIDRPPSEFKEMKSIKAHLMKKLPMIQREMRHKPALKRQVLHVQAMKSVRDIFTAGTKQVKGGAPSFTLL
ncbi:uncharacterized protein [Physcomitrium patens]|uniref:uncharacterized protein isoform X2 n=1 Tax=Physcomitrium patens TaxID=3218 RepID=UPI000D15F13B|nr:uncharacterized protein LOC112278221 isoform X2 [Physcomitrium patens]|eukprot:XP_024367162.1 uncharacterized protein LOC112278221 isoform X2 [Physcomitrella patens]